MTYGEALKLAKEAGKKEKQLRRLRENSGTIEQYNPDLMYYVTFNLGNQYDKNNVPEEALDYYTTLVKNKNLQNSGRFRVNMGNIYYK
jgi:intraflagellar transport protein 88